VLEDYILSFVNCFVQLNVKDLLKITGLYCVKYNTVKYNTITNREYYNHTLIGITLIFDKYNKSSI